MELFYIFIAAVFSNNYVLSQLLGIYPAIDKAKDSRSYILREGILMTTVTIILALLGHTLYIKVLNPLEISYMATTVMTLLLFVIAQFTVLISSKMGKDNDIEVSAEHIISNSIVLAVILFTIGQENTMLEVAIKALGAGAGYTLVSILLADIMEMVDEDLVVPAFRGVPLKLITLGLMAYAFWGFCCLA